MADALAVSIPLRSLHPLGFFGAWVFLPSIPEHQVWSVFVSIPFFGAWVFLRNIRVGEYTFPELVSIPFFGAWVFLLNAVKIITIRIIKVSIPFFGAWVFLLGKSLKVIRVLRFQSPSSGRGYSYV